MKDEEPLQGFLQNCCMTLLGATAWVLQARIDIAVYVSALRRRTQQPRAIDLRRLNRVILATQTNPQGLQYHQLPEPRVVLAVGDSAFQAPSEEDIAEGSGPLAMRGYILAWAHRTVIHDATSSPSSSAAAGPARKVPQGVTLGRRRYQLQILDYSVGKQNHVCRGVWSSELHNQCDMVEMASIVAGFTLEAARGPQSGGAMVQAMSQGQVPMSIEALTDIYSILAAILPQPISSSRQRRGPSTT